MVKGSGVSFKKKKENLETEFSISHEDREKNIF